ncbi:hypothetical protein CWI42_041400 [Ordospora colligata]|uniref:Uncharacterized protein n=1 Tax=Ordospora colligata OC4 TaxID=1354746 RepID=A0A0B2UKP8_9MICR|nr:uncharacterized protein M896_041410 [Ordospora colligata OC4]KHN69943.1 hypothetical protein M896_041410 [Ordospora colligata OC4]TBU16113.1 hypothetical protein CWI41_041400 [Ordospora colligata]TBU16326.1 hypothetical protein CWI40_041400 [Ordospora colligata]TBU19030.1 hypothetical protein CWI42_041400 [Ordospora colligata]
MISLPGYQADILLHNGCPFVEIGLPEIGCKATAKIVRVSFTQVVLRIFEVDGKRCSLEYRAVFRPAEFDPEEHLCSRFTVGSVVSCVVISYGDCGVIVSM